MMASKLRVTSARAVLGTLLGFSFEAALSISFGAALCAASLSPALAQVSQEPLAPPVPVPVPVPAPASAPAPSAPSDSTPAPLPPEKVVDMEEDEDEDTPAQAPVTGEAPAPSAAPVTSAAPAAAAASVAPGTVQTPVPGEKQPKKAANSAPRAPAVDYAALPFTYHQKRFDLGVGLRLHWVTDADFELFSDSPLIPMLTVRAGGTAWTSGRFSLAVLGEWDYGTSAGDARGVPTQAYMHRLQVGGEVRYHVAHWLAPYGRLSMGAARFSSRIGEEDAFTALEQASYQFIGALNAGAALRVLGSRDERERAPRLHLFFEAGYVLTTSAQLNYQMRDDGPLRPEGLDLGSIPLGGPQMSFGLLGSF